MRYILEIIPNDGPGQSFLCNILHVKEDNETLAEHLLDVNDAPDKIGAMWLGIKTLEEIYETYKREGWE